LKRLYALGKAYPPYLFWKPGQFRLKKITLSASDCATGSREQRAQIEAGIIELLKILQEPREMLLPIAGDSATGIG
jgi:hypothetical protein